VLLIRAQYKPVNVGSKVNTDKLTTMNDLTEYIKLNHRFPKSSDDLMYNYYYYTTPVISVLLGLYMTYLNFRHDFTWILLIFSVFFLGYGIYHSLIGSKIIEKGNSFEVIKSNADQTVEMIANKLKSNFNLKGIEVHKDLETIIGTTKMSAFSGGETITLILDKKTLLINSRPRGAIQPLTIFKDRKNIKKLKRLL